jgi:hypothetical protein
MCPRRLAAIVTSSFVAWGCQPPGLSSEPDGSSDVSVPEEAASETHDATNDGTEGDSPTDSGLGADATLADDDSGGGPVDAAPDAPVLDAAPDEPVLDAAPDAPGADAGEEASGPDAASMDAGCSLAMQHLVVTSTAGGALANPFVVRASCAGSAGTTVDHTPTPNGFALTNTSAGPVTWTARVSSTYFSLDNVGSTLAAGDSVAVTVSAVALSGYPPGQTVDDAVVVTEGDPSACAHSLPIQEAFEGYFFLPATLAFGDVALGRSSTLHVAATFTGSSYFAGVLSAGPPPDFAGSVQAGPAPITGLDVAFSPSALGPRSGTVSFVGYMNPVCTPPIVASGNGVPAPSPACASLDSGAPCVDGGV